LGTKIQSRLTLKWITLDLLKPLFKRKIGNQAKITPMVVVVALDLYLQMETCIRKIKTACNTRLKILSLLNTEEHLRLVGLLTTPQTKTL
jgi:hypothetical protein